jgi:hypothetical protein
MQHVPMSLRLPISAFDLSGKWLRGTARQFDSASREDNTD